MREMLARITGRRMKIQTRFRVNRQPMSGRWYIWAVDRHGRPMALIGSRRSHAEAIDYIYQYVKKPPSWAGWMRQP